MFEVYTKIGRSIKEGQEVCGFRKTRENEETTMHWKFRRWTLIGTLLLAAPGAMVTMRAAAA
ncbi:MAG: hypothetical protein ACRD3K_09360, partial [Edaphobacter sp.]